MSENRWIDLEGAVNVRDAGGLPVTGGGVTARGRLIRSDSLQALTPADVRHLVDDLKVRSVADLRTGVEVAGEGPGPMTREPSVTVTHLSLFPEPDEVAVAPSADGPVVLPWQTRDAEASDEERRRGAAGVYARYLDDRPDSVIAALRLVATTDGATIVHCAAGKDRTGVVVAFALAEVGVPADAIVEDYTLTAERIEAIIDKLSARDTYRGDLDPAEARTRHAPRPETMQGLLAEMDERFGGVGPWLRANGWTDDDARALRSALVA